MTLHPTPSNPVPEGAVTGDITTSDGVRLRFARFPAQDTLRGTVAVLPGRTEFIEKYFEVVRDLQARGFAVAVLDWRSQGGSQRLAGNPRKGHVRRFSDYLADLDAFAKQVLLPDCPAPHFALGHSMGGTILLEAVVAGRRWFDRMVLCAPMLGLEVVPMEGLVRPLARGLSLVGFARAYVPGGGSAAVTEMPFQNNILTSDAARYTRTAEIVRAHPELGLGSPTIGWLAAAYESMGRLAHPETVVGIRQPLLMVVAGADRLVTNDAIEKLSARLIAGAHVVVPASRHEILMERELFRAQFWAAFDAFIPGTPL
ncbi:alpha/beta fold hydrolase [Xanthobacter tagetidis]|jgi:lysophospholipase|uniref:Alpha/beta hydrolase n=1 Tax=Xanthobacter tagetidis TaxID=60216 RepID=A0A3L7AHP3_9HYPH|nr:alpha/beta hydrolase [Xanthobacter tagetidis]MBB6306930.1 lysophospholipase [Xanthobacter tagetidis]RLP80006.1 alpha/beta hydrolase [Xanthobacter tagetidis]